MTLECHLSQRPFHVVATWLMFVKERTLGMGA